MVMGKRWQKNREIQEFRAHPVFQHQLFDHGLPFSLLGTTFLNMTRARSDTGQLT